MPDVIDQLRRYGEAVEHAAVKAPLLSATEPGAERRPRRVGVLVAAASIAAVLMVGAAAVFLATRDQASVAIGANRAVSWVPLPAETDVAVPANLADGTPVWVVKDSDGHVRVFDAASTHKPYGVSVLVGWCERTGRFEDPMYQSQWTLDGTKIGGPAPSTLGQYDARVVGERVRVAGVARSRPAVPPTSSSGRPCWTEPALGYSPGSQVRPTLEGIPSVRGPALNRSDSSMTPRLLLVEGWDLVLLEGGSAEVCQRTGNGIIAGPGPCVPITLTDAPADLVIGSDHATRGRLVGDFLARVHGGRVANVVYPSGYGVVDESKAPAIVVTPPPDLAQVAGLQDPTVYSTGRCFAGSGARVGCSTPHATEEFASFEFDASIVGISPNLAAEGCQRLFGEFTGIEYRSQDQYAVLPASTDQSASRVSVRCSITSAVAGNQLTSTLRRA